MIRAALLFLILSLLPVLASAQDLRTFTIIPPGESGFTYTIQRPDEPKDSLPITGKSVEAAAPEDPNGYRVYITNSETNRAASADLIQILKTKKFAPKKEEFKLIAEVVFQFQTAEGMIDNGVLNITGTDPRLILITPADNNRVIQKFLPEKFGYRVDYQANGQKQFSESKNVSVAETATVMIDIPAKFATTPAPSTGESAKPAESPIKTGEQKNPLVSIFQNIIGLAIVAGLAYAGYWYYKNNQQVVEKLANQAGLKPQDPSDPTGALPADPPKKELEKIVLSGTSLPNPEEVQSGVATPTTATTKNPRLVKADGNIHLIPEGTQIVGRESADLTLTGESSVSRAHAQIDRSSAQITVIDSESTNGTYINGTKITSPTVLTPGDTVQFGAVSFRYEE